MSVKDPVVYLKHIRDCCRNILEYQALSEPGALPVKFTLDAVIRNLEVIGEASRRIGPEFREAHPQIPWRRMADLRNLLIHAYEQVDPSIIQGVVARDVPELLSAVSRLLGEG